MRVADVDLREDHAALVRHVLRSNLPPGACTWVFGSRAKWAAKDSSDLDLAVDAGRALTLSERSQLAEAFDESTLPWKVDVVDIHSISSKFREIIRRDGVLFFDGAHDLAPSNLQEHKLGDIIELKRGYDLPSDQRLPGAYPIISSAGVTGHHSRAMVKAPGVVTGRYGTIGQVFFVEGDFWPLNTTLYVRDFKGNHPKYIYYLLKTLDWNRFNDKSSVPGVNRNHVHEALVEVPPLKYQAAIATILSTLDDKIELSRRVNETLEAVARAIFKDWFVDFGPTRAKMERRAPYLAPEIWALFPERLDDGGKPEGWQKRPIGTLLESSIGGDWGVEEADGDQNNKVSIIRGTDMPDLIAGGIGKVPTRFTTLKKAKSRKLEDLDIVIEVSGGSPSQPTGRSLLVTRSILDRFANPVVCASFCRRFRPVSSIAAVLVAQHLAHLYSVGGTWEYQNQSTGIANFQTTYFLKEELVTWAGDRVCQAFANLIEPIIRRSTSNESLALAAMRDLLLPRLMSGEIRIKDAGKIAETGA